MASCTFPVIGVVGLLPELLFRLRPSLQPGRRSLDVGGNAFVMSKSTPSWAQSIRRGIHEILTFWPRVRVVQVLVAHTRRRNGSWRLRSWSCRRSLRILRIVHMTPRAIGSIALPWPQALGHLLLFSPASIVPSAVGRVAGPSRSGPSGRYGRSAPLSFRGLSLPRAGPSRRGKPWPTLVRTVLSQNREY